MNRYTSHQNQNLLRAPPVESHAATESPPLPALPIESRAATAADEPPRAFNYQISNVNERDDGLNLAVPQQAGNERVSILQNGARLIYVPRAQRPSLIDRQLQAPRRRIYVPQAKRPSLTDRQRPFVSPKLRNPS